MREKRSGVMQSSPKSENKKVLLCVLLLPAQNAICSRGGIGIALVSLDESISPPFTCLCLLACYTLVLYTVFTVHLSLYLLAS